jgi:beta-N-acetylhexosaminidase
LIVAGFDGAELPPRLHEQLARGELGGVILFKRNLPSVEAAYDICRAAAAAVAPELAPFISVDQEGGRVVRLPDPVLRLPAMRVLGTIADPAMTRRAADLIGQQLAAIGFNLNFAPVLDVDTNPKNPIIGDRSFAPDPDVVARMGRAFIEGLQAEGVMACAKHFPGHGDTSKDSHVDLPTLSHDKQRLDAIELPPFRTASLRGVAAMMTAHILYPELDPGVPATLSHRICTGILRSEIGFSGVLFSDDLEMRALSDQLEIEQTAVGAVRAGCDALLICHDADLQERARVALITKAESDADFRNRCQQAVTRSLAARRRYPPRAAAHLSEVEALLAARTGAELIAEINARIGQ